MLLKESRNSGLDITRVIAISFVLINHTIGNIYRNDMGFSWYIAYFGVDLFFALSGFLIGRILIEYCDMKKGVLTARHTAVFLMRRWFRTVPLYYIILVIVFFMERWLFHNPRSFDWRYLVWLQSVEGPRPEFFGISWSLCIEEWFYATFAVGFFLFSCLFKGSVKTKFLVFTIIYVAVFTIIRFVYAPPDYTTFTSTAFRLDTIGYGVLMAYYHHYYSLKSKKLLPVLLILSAMLCATGICCLFTRVNMNLYYSFAGAALAIFVYCMALLFTSVKKIALIRHLSKISYSMYLVNLHVIYLVLRYINVGNSLQLIIALVSILLISNITYRFVEKPFLRLRDKYSGV